MNESTQPQFRPTPCKLIVGPVKGVMGTIYSAESDMLAQIRGWGRLQYFKDGDKLQDRIEAWVVEAINEKLLKDPI